MINKDYFVRILARVKDASETEEKIQNILDKSLSMTMNDFADFRGIIAPNDDIIISLLDNMFDTDMISYWCWELEFGKRYKKGDVTTADGKNIDISTAEKLYYYCKNELEK